MRCHTKNCSNLSFTSPWRCSASTWTIDRAYTYTRKIQPSTRRWSTNRHVLSLSLVLRRQERTMNCREPRQYTCPRGARLWLLHVAVGRGGPSTDRLWLVAVGNARICSQPQPATWPAPALSTVVVRMRHSTAWSPGEGGAICTEAIVIKF